MSNKYTIESRYASDLMIVVRNLEGVSSGYDIVPAHWGQAYRFTNRKQAEMLLFTLKKKHDLHGGFKIHEVQS
ncbi:MAG: hypothetical protein L3K52_15370 [Candidatus Thiothrix sulfatifontis]|nr:MAG: hypothetical protein L3K52_15370 [Candidatus Thiothrix sulfatifontis]